MTDNEIIKALKCLCWNHSKCRECPYSPRYEFPLCQRQIAKDALDLIKRQKAENDSAKAKIEICAEVIERQDAEIKRVKECPKCVYEYNGEVTEYCVQGPCPNFKTVEQIKVKAYKEFAEELKNILRNIPKWNVKKLNFNNVGFSYDDVFFSIDNLLKGMVGEEE